MFQRIQQIGQLIRGMKNPQQAVLQMLGSNTNPMAQNVLKMVQNGDMNGVEQFARNICKEQGVDFDKEFSSFKNNLGM